MKHEWPKVSASHPTGGWFDPPWNPHCLLQFQLQWACRVPIYIGKHYFWMEKGRHAMKLYPSIILPILILIHVSIPIQKLIEIPIEILIIIIMLILDALTIIITLLVQISTFIPMGPIVMWVSQWRSAVLDLIRHLQLCHYSANTMDQDQVKSSC